MAQKVENITVDPIIELLTEKGFDALPDAMAALLNQVMLIERSRHLNAESYERTAARAGYANGFKPKTLQTRMGGIALEVPQVRDGSFYPSVLEKGLRSERALKLAIAEMYVQGVSTRRVKKITEELCGLDISSADVSRAAKALDETFARWRQRRLGKYKYVFVDARYEKVRQDGCVISSAVLIAFGINYEGQREVLGVSVSLSEQEVHWRDFLLSLTERGLHGVELIISDAHAGLKAARKAVFPHIPWQRCQFHLQQNAQSYVSKQSIKREVAADIRAILQAPNMEEAERQLRLVVGKYRKTARKLSDWMEENIPESLTIMHFPESHRRRIRTSNIAERVNKEVRRRTKVASIFPNPESCLRLVTAVLMEIDEEWQDGMKYLDVSN